MKSVVELGDPAPLLPAGAQPHAEPAAGAHRPLALDRLLVLADRVAAGVEETDQPLHPVRGDHHHGQQGQADQHQDPGEHPARCADDPQQRQKDDQQHERGAQVVAQHHQHGQEADPGQQRDEQLPPVAQLVQLLLAGQQVRAPQQEREFGQLGRLELEAADLQPAGRPAAARRRGHEQDDDQPEQRDEHQRVGGGAVPAGRGPRGQPHAGQPDQHAEQLVLQAGPRRAARHQPGRGRGGQHHHQAEREQQRGDAEDQVEVGERAVQEAEPGGHPVARLPGPGHRSAGCGGGRRYLVHDPSFGPRHRRSTDIRPRVALLVRGDDPPGPPARRCAPNAGSASTPLRRASPHRRAITGTAECTIWASIRRRRCRGRARRTWPRSARTGSRWWFPPSRSARSDAVAAPSGTPVYRSS